LGKLKKIGMGVGLTVLGFFVLAIIVGVTYHPSTTQSTQNNLSSSIDQAKIDEANKVTGVTNFEIIKLGSLYQARFSLVDANSAQVASDTKVTLQVKQDDGTVVYSQSFDVHDNEF
jgi:hypothetical protein